ncbi:MAG: 6-bladed beta-propeller [Candidatus Aminicenantes bacterium]|nr:6-bladed beta-propeller [Candidatus Aminicenantes bacterium]
MKKIYPCVLLSLIFSILVFSVSFSQETETKDGIQIIHNTDKSLKNSSLNLSLELVHTLGDINTPDENLAFYLPEDIVFDDKGNIFVLDSGNHRIQKFNPEYEYITTIGRQGQGPGEFYFPSSLALDEDNFLYISDPRNNRIQILNPDGSEHKTIKFPKEQVGSIKVLKSGNILMNQTGSLMMISQSDENELPTLLQVFDRKGNLVREAGEPTDFKHRLLNHLGNQFECAVDGKDNVYLTFLHQNKIEKYSPEGKLLWRADRPLNYSMDPPKNKGKMESRGGSMTVMMPKMNKCSEGISVDSEGRVWVITLDRQLKKDEQVRKQMGMQISNGQRSMSVKLMGNTEQTQTNAYVLEIFNPQGILIQRIPLECFVNEIHIHKDRVFLLDKERGTKFYEYKIIEK